MWNNMSIKVGVHSKGTFSLSDVINSIKGKSEFNKTGAIAIFIGVVRGVTKENKQVKRLELEAYEEQADQIINNICEDLKKEEDISDVQIHHFLGSFEVSEDLVYVLVTGAHRQNVFKILEKAVDRYKTEAPIFKKEYVIDRNGKTKSYWISEYKENKAT